MRENWVFCKQKPTVFTVGFIFLCIFGQHFAYQLEYEGEDERQNDE